MLVLRREDIQSANLCLEQQHNKVGASYGHCRIRMGWPNNLRARMEGKRTQTYTWGLRPAILNDFTRDENG